MAQRIWRSDDTSPWLYEFGSGVNGAYTPSTGTDAPVDSACTGTAGTSSLTATNAGFAAGQLILIHQTKGTGAGNYELNKISSYVAGTITTVHTLINNYNTGAQVLVLPQYSSSNIAGGVTLTGKAWDGTVGGIYAKFCNSTFTVAGSLTLNGVGFRGGAGVAGDGSTGNQGESHAGTGTISTSANATASGGSYKAVGSFNASIGGAGHAAAGGAGSNKDSSVAGAAGGSIGVASLVTAFLGGGSGGSGGNAAQNGVNGGGFVFIAAPTIIVTGSLSLNGQDGASTGDGNTAAGGGGAGGSCLLKAQTLTLGSNLITATGGVKGTNSQSNVNGGDGSVGRIHADYSGSISGTTSPTIDTTNDTTIRETKGAAFLFNML